MNIQIPAHSIEFNEYGNTIWVHSPIGATILRIKTLGKITINKECENICSHSDMIVKENIEICLSEDAKILSDLDKLKQTYDALGISYVVVDKGSGYHLLYKSTEEEKVNCDFKSKEFFEFLDGKLVSW